MSSTAGAWEILWELRVSGDVQVQKSGRMSCSEFPGAQVHTWEQVMCQSLPGIKVQAQKWSGGMPWGKDTESLGMSKCQG